MPLRNQRQQQNNNNQREQSPFAAAAAGQNQQQGFGTPSDVSATAAAASSESGTQSLLAMINKPMIVAWFFILIFRDMNLYELADQVTSGRMMLVFPILLLAMMNMTGFVTGLLAPNLSKTRLKLFLNLNKLAELLLLGYNMMRLILLPSMWTPREDYIGRIFVNLAFLIQHQVCTSAQWGSLGMKKTSDGGGGGAGGVNRQPTSAFAQQQQNAQAAGYGGDY
jgi:hypothetical protein